MARLMLKQILKMVVRNLQIFKHTFTNRNTRHHDHKFLEAVKPVQLVDGAKIHIGFAGSGLHFNREVRYSAAFLGTFRQLVCLLYPLHVLQQRIGIKR